MRLYEHGKKGPGVVTMKWNLGTLERRRMLPCLLAMLVLVGTGYGVAQGAPGQDTDGGAGAMGVIDAPTKTVHAAALFVVDAAQIKKAREDLGKTYITGKVAAIDDVNLTIERPDGVSQKIMVDESTSF